MPCSPRTRSTISIFLPGFSTAETVSDISGRGVGMDVVRRNIQDIGGRISLKSERGRGMTIQLALPLTLAVMDGMVDRGRQRDLCAADVGDRRMPAADARRHAPLDRHARHAASCAARSCRWSISPICSTSDRRRRRSANGVVIITEASEGVRFGLVVDELLRSPAGRDQEHRGELRRRAGNRRRDDSRQRPRRVHPRYRKVVRAGGHGSAAVVGRCQTSRTSTAAA